MRKLKRRPHHSNSTVQSMFLIFTYGSTLCTSSFSYHSSFSMFVFLLSSVLMVCNVLCCVAGYYCLFKIRTLKYIWQKQNHTKIFWLVLSNVPLILGPWKQHGVSRTNTYHPLTPPKAICVATEYFSATGPEFFPKRRFHHRWRLAYSVRSTTLS